MHSRDTLVVIRLTLPLPDVADERETLYGHIKDRNPNW